MSDFRRRITQAQLESYLWGAATLLRGHLDAGDYKQYIFPLLFFKRVSDVHDEETAAVLTETGGDAEAAAFPENHRLAVPPDAHWDAVRSESRRLGSAIQRAFRAIESANPGRLDGIFGDAAWTNADRLPDATLKDLLEHFSTLTLSTANLPEDELGNGYEFLIRRFADDSGHTAAEFYTNRTVVHLMTELLEPVPGESVYDPTCGSGGMLISAIARLKSQGREWRNVGLFGQERNLMTSAIARMNVLLHGIEDSRVVRGDTLAHPKLLEGDRLQRFDVVLANPPYSIKQWDRDRFAADPFGRNAWGTPPQGCADYAFQQHIAASLKPGTGRCAVLWPHGVLFRNAEADMRKAMIEGGTVEAVIGLGPNLFYNSPMEACILVCRREKPAELDGKVLFINAVDDVAREQATSFLTDAHIARIVAAYRGRVDMPGYAAVVGHDRLAQNGFNLSIPLYVTPAAGDPADRDRKSSLKATVRGWRESSTRLRASMDELLASLES